MLIATFVRIPEEGEKREDAVATRATAQSISIGRLKA